MPVNIPDELPAADTLKKENIFVMTRSRAIHQDIRPLNILILNLMPLKIDTETHLLRVLSNSPLQVEVTLLQTTTHTPQNTSQHHLKTFYSTFEEIRNDKFDGMIFTGAPVEHLDFEEVDYWKEIRTIMDWAKHHVTSSLFICWAAQAGLFHYYNVPKYHLPKKMFGVFEHRLNRPLEPIVRGFDEVFVAPHSRHTEIRREDILKQPELQLVAESEKAGVYIVASKSGKQIFVTGHAEYDPLTLKGEYERDKSRGMDIEVPENYFPDNDPRRFPMVRWKSHAHLLFSNWLNYYVYQITPFKIEDIS
ncbi:MAG: homoserine O-succinyltransferase [Spirochaetales bacterium]|nr:homoserine O-succinyltransferase [Spirochaetales bacterium]